MIRHDTLEPGVGRQPVIWNVRNGDTAAEEEITAWLKASQVEMDHILDHHGALLLRGLSSVREPRHFDSVIRSNSPMLRDYVGGTSPRNTVYGKIMTATNVPPTWSIPLHQEMAYTQNPPDRIAFFCRTPAGQGGFSTLGDMASVLAAIPAEIRAKFETKGLRLRRTLPSETTKHLKPGVKKTWMEVFDTSDPGRVNEVIEEKGWLGTWLPQGVLQIWHEVLPAVRTHPVSGKSTWFNQAHFFSPACMIDWAARDGRNEDQIELETAYQRNPEMLDNIFFGDNEPLDDDTAREIQAVIASAEQPTQLAESDILILDNTLVAHGRTAFAGQREVFVALITVPRFHESRTEPITV